MKDGWRSFKLKELIERFIDYRGKTPRKTTFGIPLITAKIVKSGFINSPEEFIAEEDYNSWMTRGLPQKGDVLLTTEAPLGEVAQIKTDDRVALAQRIIALRGKKNILDNTFLKFALQSSTIQQRLHARGSGSTVQGIKSSELQQVQIELPPFPIQIYIADILGALDDKIECNRRINQTLEAMAQALYKHWFIDFGPFRGSAFVDSAVGQIPRDWHAGRLGELTNNVRETTDPRTLRSDVPYIGLEHMPKGSIALAEWGTASDVTSNKCVFHRKHILFGKLRPYFKKVGVAPVDGVCSSDILVIEPLDSDFYGISLCQVIQDEFISFTDAASAGTRMPRISWEQMAQHPMAIPPKNVAAQFSTQIEVWVNLIISNIEENKMLASTRDYLLPKLLSGDIEIQAAEEQIEELV